MESVIVQTRPAMQNTWQEARFFSAQPDWLKEAMACDAVRPVDDTNPQVWEVGYHADGESVQVGPGGAIMLVGDTVKGSA